MCFWELDLLLFYASRLGTDVEASGAEPRFEPRPASSHHRSSATALHARLQNWIFLRIKMKAFLNWKESLTESQKADPLSLLRFISVILSHLASLPVTFWFITWLATPIRRSLWTLCTKDKLKAVLTDTVLRVWYWCCTRLSTLRAG